VRVLLSVTASEIAALHDCPQFLRYHPEDRAGFSLVLAGNDDNLVAFPDLELGHHSTSGASEMIFIWFFALSSRGTGPKIRVPTGSPWLLMRTAALRSKRM